MTAGLLATDPVALGPYWLLGRLGGGGMGQVYLARSPGGRLVAVKVIRPEFAADPEFRVRFAREVANARTVSGIFTAALVDADTDGPVPWLATGYIPGPPLSAAVRDGGPLPLASLRPLAAGLAEALAAIHGAGVVHRDLKPSNVLLASDGPRVIDFGISYAAEASALTHSGAVMGSPGYMSPEQAQGRPVGPASDVFSLGAVLAFAATGAGPFGAGSVPALVYRAVNEAPDLSGVPRELRPTIERCLAKAPGDRPGLGDLLAEWGGEVIPANWLPEAVADTFPRYEPSVRIAALAAPEAAVTVAPAAGPPEPLEPDTRGREEPGPGLPTEDVAAGAVATGGAAAPPARRILVARGVPPWWRGVPARLRRHRALSGIAVVVIAAILATAITLGTGTLGRRSGDPTSPRVTAGGSVTPTIDGQTSAATTAPAGPGSPRASATTHRAKATPATTRTATTSVTTRPPASSSAATTPASRAGTSAATTPAPQSSPASPAQPATTSLGGVSATNATLYSCSSNYPVGSATSTSASYQWTNNTSGTAYIYYAESSFYSGETGTVSANSSTGSTLAVGGSYLVEDPIGTCLAVVHIDSTSGSVTIN
jgi:hypothetical protein